LIDNKLLNNLQVSSGSVRIVNPIGSTLQQRYQILEQLGQTGSVTTYLAIDLQIPGNLQLKCVIHRHELLDSTPDSPDWYRAALSAQSLYTLTRHIDQLPTVYSYFAEGTAFYVVREFVAGISLAQELLPNRPWNQSQVVMLLVDLLEVLHDIDRYAAIPDLLTLTQILRRSLDRKLVLLNLPLIQSIVPNSSGSVDLNLAQQNLQVLGEIAIAAATGIAGANLPLTTTQTAQWHQRAPQIDYSELITVIDRLIAINPQDRYPSITGAWQAVVGVMSKLLVHQHSRADTQTEIAKHVQILVDRGTGFYEIGDCSQAITAYDRALLLDPRCVEAYCGRGNARRYQGDYTGSWEDFDAAIRLDPQQGVAYIGRALATCFGHHPDPSAGPDFECGQHLLTHPTNAIEYVMRGTAKAQLSDSQGAIEDYTTAIALNPRLVLAYNNRGNLRQHFGDIDGAIADFTKVLEINPQSPIAYNNRAIIYTQLGQFSAAITDYDRAIELQPDFVSVYNNQGNAYCQMGQYPEAIDRYSQAIKLDPEFAVAYSNRANIYRIQGDLKLALEDYDRAISLDANLVIAYYNRGICHRQIGNHQAAIDDYTTTLNLDPQYFYAYYHRGNARKYLGDKHGAIADYTQTIYCDPNHIYAHYNRAVTRSEIGDLRGAIEDLEQSIELYPTFALAYYQRGYLLATNHEHQYAIADYQRAIELDPNNLDTYYQRGCSYHSLGNLSAALADFTQTIDMDINYAPAYYQRGKVANQLGDRTGSITDYHKAANLYLDRGDSKTYQQILQVLDRLVISS
jgi:tetratricopeptide (TPR) repeat protein